MIFRPFYIILLHVLISDCHVCEKGLIKGEIQILDGKHWKSLNGSSNVFQSFGNAKNQSKQFETGFDTESLTELSKTIRSLAPGFTLKSETLNNEQCKIDNDEFLKELGKLKLWALKMYDSSGKLSSGILNGNVNQFGDFDQCLSVVNPSGRIKGKYCLAYFLIKLKNGVRDEIREISRLIQSWNAFRSEMSTPGHRIPRFSNINWALCVPSSCTHNDIQLQLRDFIAHYNVRADIDVEVQVHEEMCHVQKEFEFSNTFLFVSMVFVSITLLVAASTALDNKERSESFSVNLFNCFSLKKNLKGLISNERLDDDISAVHGIRMISSILLLVSHKSMAMFFLPYQNRTYMVEKLSTSFATVARIASLYTDSFIMISGTLTAYSLSLKLKKNGTMKVKSEYISRLIRIYPLMIIIILLSTFIVPELASGPQSGLTVVNHSKYCKDFWWRNLLFIHNYFGFENMCLMHTHHLGIDTQLFLLSPALIYILYKWQLIGMGILTLMAAISTGFRYQLTLDKNLSYFVYPGISASQMINTANYSYTIPSHRLTTYVIGIMLGYTLRCYGRDYKINSNLKTILWMISLGMFYYLIRKATSMSHLGYIYNEYEAAYYAALAPIVWCFILSWIIFTTHINPKGIITRVFSSKLCLFWTRISYAVYLVQFSIFFFNVAQQRYSQEYSILSMVNLMEYSFVIAASIVLTLFIEMPSNNIRKLLRQRLNGTH